MNASEQSRGDFVDLLDTVSYHVLPAAGAAAAVDTAAFRRVFSSRGVPAKLWRMVDQNEDGAVSVDELANALLMLSKQSVRNAASIAVLKLVLLFLK